MMGRPMKVGLRRPTSGHSEAQSVVVLRDSLAGVPVLRSRGTRSR